jgi:hypothetical protein
MTRWSLVTHSGAATDLGLLGYDMLASKRRVLLTHMHSFISHKNGILRIYLILKNSNIHYYFPKIPSLEPTRSQLIALSVTSLT